jgi:hypothetical protein
MERVSLDRIYLKRLGKFSGFKVWIVDGKYIRDNIEEEFTNYGEHKMFIFIPEDEFWIDKERNPGEEKYFIDSMLVINRLMSKGISYRKALGVADRIEKRERSKSGLMKKELKIKKSKGNILKTVYKSLIKEYSNGKIKIWVINGELVRDLFFIDFTEGGHDKVYNFIPENEVWIDDDLDLAERKFVILHELHERNLMSRGKDYDHAHNSSSKIEYYCRRHPKKLDRHLRKELKKSERM